MYEKKPIKPLTAFVTAGVMALTSAAVLHDIPSTSVSAADTVRILAIGDSITHGYINSDNGYRKYLNYYLQQSGITNFDMVGPNNRESNSATYNWNGTTITYDPQHAGYSGYAIEKIVGRSGIRETMFNDTYFNEGISGNMMEAYQPDVVLLQIGTNDILDAQLDGAADRLETLVDLILPYLNGSDQCLYLASIPDIDAALRNDWLGPYQWKLGLSYTNDPQGFIAAVQNAVDTYNDSVEALVQKKQQQGYHIRFSDIHSTIDYKTQLEDGVHPNENGYASMGKHWAELLKNTYFNGSGMTPVETTPTQTTTTTTETTTTTTEATTTTTEATTTTTEATTTTTEATTSATEQTYPTYATTTSTTEDIYSCSILELPDKTVYQIGEALDLTGGKVLVAHGYMPSTACWDMTDWGGIDTSEFDSSKAGTYTIYLYNGTASDSFTVTVEETPGIVPGNLDGTEGVGLQDVILLQKYLLGCEKLTKAQFLAADLNQDGKVNAIDAVFLKRIVFGNE